MDDRELDLDSLTLPLFVQLNVKADDAAEESGTWKETSRWVKFQEDVEDGGKRWSKPFVPAVPLSAIMDIRQYLHEGIVAFDVKEYGIVDILDGIRDFQLLGDSAEQSNPSTWQALSENMQELKEMLSLETKMRVKTRLLAKVSFVMANHNILSSGSHEGSTNSTINNGDPDKSKRDQQDPEGRPHLKHSISEPSSERLFSEATANSATSAGLDMNPFVKKLPKGAESCLIMVGTANFATFPMVIFVRLHKPQIFRNHCEVPNPTRFVCIIVGPPNAQTRILDMGKALGTLMSDQIFPLVAYKATSKEQLVTGIDSYTQEVTVLAPSVWDREVRLEPPDTLPTVAKRMTQRLLHNSSSNSRIEDDVGDDGTDKESTADEKTGLMLQTPSESTGNEISTEHKSDEANLYFQLERGISRVETGGKCDDLGFGEEKFDNSHGNEEALMRTGKLFGGLMADIKRKSVWFVSDFRDGLHIQSLATIIYIYLATITKAITFGGFLGDITNGEQGVLESFLGHALAGGVFCLLGGQPLTVLGCTGPVLIFEKILVDFCAAQGYHYMTVRLWIGIWSSLLCIVVVAFDLSSFVRYFTRFTEESFAALVGIIFIFESLKKLYKLSNQYKVHEGFHLDHVAFVEEYCHCIPADNNTAPTFFANASKLHRAEFQEVSSRVNGSMLDYHDIPWDHLTTDECKIFGGTLEGEWCNYVPDIFFFSVTLFFGTFLLATWLKQFKMSRYFPNFVRSLISDYAVILSILTFVLVDHHFNLETPKLIVPTVFMPTRSDLRGWIIPFTHPNIPWYLYIAAIIPAVLLTILLFMDQQITSVIVNRKEHKLKKGAGYHLDMLVVGIMMGFCSILGLPWCVAATVLCLGHVDSLKMETETSAPGEKPRFLGVREQRITGTAVFILTGLSVKLAPVLAYIPMPVLYGVLMYMGISALKGMQFVDRLGLFFMPTKYQPDYYYLRHVPIKTVHLFTFIQVLALGGLWLLKSTKASLVFPLMVLALVGFRKSMDYFPRIFSQRDLFWLDNLMPSSTDKKSDEDSEKKTKHARFFSIPKFWKVENEIVANEEEVNKANLLKLDKN